MTIVCILLILLFINYYWIEDGIFGFPKNKCDEILVSEAVDFIHKNPKSSLEIIEFCVYGDDAFSYFSKQLELL
jgi:O-acetyl-ADP-ribose deacetylase (regulator of RNase III)